MCNVNQKYKEIVGNKISQDYNCKKSQDVRLKKTNKGVLI